MTSVQIGQRPSLRTLLLDLIRPLDTLQFSQFTIDWIEELDHALTSEQESQAVRHDGALTYRIDTIVEIMKTCGDLRFFQMLQWYAEFYASPLPKPDKGGS